MKETVRRTVTAQRTGEETYKLFKGKEEIGNLILAAQDNKFYFWPTYMGFRHVSQSVLTEIVEFLNELNKERPDANTKNVCTLSDYELAQKVEEWVNKLCVTGGTAWSLRVPPDYNNDPDLLIMEVLKRMKMYAEI